jgi:hypothetical protein
VIQLRIADCGLRLCNRGVTDSKLKDRTKAFALRIVRLVESLPRGMTVAALRDEASALTAIAVKSIRTARTSLSNPQPAIRTPQSP